jgi:hypothetical protein
MSRIAQSIQLRQQQEQAKPVIKKLLPQTLPNTPKKGLRILPPEREKIISRGDSLPILPPVVNPLASPEPMSDVVRDQLLAVMPERDRIKFRLLKMAEVRAEAYGLSPDEIDFTRDKDEEQEQSKEPKSTKEDLFSTD